MVGDTPTLDLCNIIGFVRDYQDNPQSAVELRFTVPRDIPSNPQSQQNAFLVKTTIKVFTDADGKFEIELPQGLWMKIVSEELGFDHTFQVPFKDEEDFDNVIGFFRREQYRLEDPERRSYYDSFSEDGGVL